MGDSEVPNWLKSLPLAPEYRPTETEFADPIAFISRVEQEAAGYGICKVIPPLPKPSKRFVFANINRSLSRSPDLGPGARGSDEGGVFTTRHQELGSRRARGSVHKQVWQSGEVYTLEQFEAKSKAFAKTRLGGTRDASALVVESLFWKAVAEKPIYVEYANDVPGSGFGTPEESLRRGNSCWSRRKRKFGRGGRNSVGGSLYGADGRVAERPSIVSSPCTDVEGTAGWKLSNSPWNLQVIARSPGSLTRFMPDEVPGVTSPMVYIGMLFSWFAWHVEDHELHSLNFLHTGSPKTWYAVPGEYASTLEDIVHMQGYGGDVDRLAAFIMLGEKRTLFSPEVLVTSGIPCCRLVQNPGEFVVTFPKAYHVGFSHGFNCGEAANFATSKWLKVAKEAAVRRAAMSYLPMLSHQQLLYMLAVSFISRVPRAFLPGARSSRLRDRKKEEREYMVKRAFLDDMTSEHSLLHSLLRKDSTLYAVYWDPDSLPSICEGGPLQTSTISCEYPGPLINKCTQEAIQSVIEDEESLNRNIKNELHAAAAGVEKATTDECPKDEHHYNEKVNYTNLYVDHDDLPCGLDVDAGTLACVACGILGYPFMSVVQPSDRGMKESLASDISLDKTTENLKLRKSFVSSFVNARENSISANEELKVEAQSLRDKNETEVSCDTKLPNCDLREHMESTSYCRVDQAIPRCSDNLCILDPQSITTSDDRINYHPMIPIESYKFDSVVENNSHACMKEVPVSVSDGKHCLHRVKELNGIGSTGDNNDHFEENSDVTNTSSRGNPSETREALGADVAGSEHNLIRRWNTSDLLLRPRTFCLQHALEVQELLQRQGGCNLLIICHSDYLKIKAQAISVAEDIGVHFGSIDIPIEIASKADLDLINMSIDDEECEEHIEDWTSKLELNLQNCVKLRKQSAVKQEMLSLALRQLFSDPIPLSVSSSLKWHSRKSRSHNKGASLNKCRLLDGANKREDCKMNNQSGASEKDQINTTHEDQPMDMANAKKRGRPKKVSPGKLQCVNEAAMAGNKDDIDKERCSSGYTACDYTELPDETDELCPVFTPGSSEMCKEIHEVSLCGRSALPGDCPGAIKLGVENEVAGANDAVDVSDSVKDFSSSTFECADIHQDTLCTNASPHDGEVGSLVESEVQQDMALDGTKIEEEVSINESTNFASVIDSSEMLLETAAKRQDNTCPGDVDMEVANSGMHQETSGEIDALIKFGKCDTSESAQVTAIVLHGGGCEPCQRKHIGVTNRNAMGAGHYFTAGTSIKCYVRRKKAAEKANLTSTIFDSVKSSPSAASLVSQGCETHRIVSTTEKEAQVQGDISSLERDDGHFNVLDVTQSEKCRNKRKREIDQLTSDQYDFGGFVRSPCERLRARTGRATSEMHDNRDKKVGSRNMLKRSSTVVAQNKKAKVDGEYGCDLERCHMKFRTKEELALHKRNRCTYEGCGKRFSKHRYAMRHQRVHTDERPLKCSWKGCTMSFKWAWARTEHLRVHTGERPYKCRVTGCGLTFRFVSDFSRHRRKTGHYVNPSST